MKCYFYDNLKVDIHVRNYSNDLAKNHTQEMETIDLHALQVPHRHTVLKTYI